jgi:ABC-type multidrug transport system fused ATPase/permease subunit
MRAVTEALSDGAVVAKRNLIKIKWVPALLIFTTLQPIMFILLFAYIFGSAIDTGGVNYREFLIAGIFPQTVIFGATLTGAGLADMKKGIIDRFRSLPMSRSAVLVGRTTSDVLDNVLVITVMSLTGLVVGWRIRTSLLEAVAGFLLLLLFAYAISWIMAWVGLLVPSVEVVQSASFIVIFPLTFIANPSSRRRTCRRCSARSQSGTGLVGDAGGARAVRQPAAERPGARHVGAAAPGGLHPHLGRADPGGLRPAVGAAVQAGRRPLTAIG